VPVRDDAAERLLVAFGKTLRDRRLDTGLSQADLAHAAGLHPTYVSSVERGERNISLVNIWRLAEALNMPPAELLMPPR
jgi:transcriptional regulator with XRE-family HTH domain